MTFDAVANKMTVDAAIVRFGNDAELDVTENENKFFIISKYSIYEFIEIN